MSCVTTGLPHHVVGDPVDVVTGANTDVQLEFRLPGPIPFLWQRYYSTARTNTPLGLGWGHSHEHERMLVHDVDGVRYTGPSGFTVGFPSPASDGDAVTVNGYTLRRITADRYSVRTAGSPVMEFAFLEGGRAPLTALVRGDHRIAFHYGPRNRLQGITTSTGERIDVSCDAAGRIVRLVRAAIGNRAARQLIAYAYDEAGDLVGGVDGYGHRFAFGYDREHRMILRKDRNGYTFRFAYDAQGRCILSGGEDGVQEVRLSYEGERTRVQYRNGGVWTYHIDPEGIVTRVEDPCGGAVTYIPGDDGRIASEIDANGDVTRWIYNAAGALIGKAPPIGGVRAPGAKGPPRIEHALPETPLEFEYGRLFIGRVRAPEPSHPLLTTLPSPLARLVQTRSNGTRAAGPVHVRDELGALVREEHADGTNRRWTFDANGNIARVIDRNGAERTYEYGSWNQLMADTDPLGRRTMYRYTPAEKLAAVTDVRGSTREFRYDQKDRLIEVRVDGTTLHRYLWDHADNLIAKLDAHGTPLIEIDVGRGGQIVQRRLSSREERFAYDEQGRCTRMAWATSETTFAYDERGRRVEEASDNGSVRHAYEDNHLRESTVLDRFRTRYAQRADGVLEIHDPTGRVHTIAHLGNGVIERRLANGRIEVAQFDADGRWLVKAVAAEGSTRVESARSYRYAPEGTLLRVEEAGRGTTEYTYDAAQQLASILLPDGSVRRFAFDETGNLVLKPGMPSARVQPGNRMTAAGATTIDYDAQGRVARMAGEREQTFAYDARGFLCDVSGADVAWQAEHDPIGRRTLVRTARGETRFVWDSDRLAAELRADGSVRIYVYAAPLAMTPLLFVDYASADAEPDRGRVYHVHSDQIGAPIRVTDEEGAVVWSARMDPFGPAQVETAEDLELSLRMPGHFHDEETGLNYNRFRYYAPQLGRYLQPDPLGVGAGLNLYAYPGNPLDQVDLRGLNCPAHPAGHNPNCEDCEDNEPTQVRGRPPEGPDPNTVAAVGEPSAALTNRPSEWPYQNPPEIYSVGPGRPLDVSQLDPNQRYLWVVDPNGNMLIAPENQPGFGRVVKHGDLTPGPNGESRGPARGGGELNYNNDNNTWVMDNNSSYTFAREDGTVSNGDNLNAAHDLLTQSGTDTSNIDASNTHGQ